MASGNDLTLNRPYLLSAPEGLTPVGLSTGRTESLVPPQHNRARCSPSFFLTSSSPSRGPARRQKSQTKRQSGECPSQDEDSPGPLLPFSDPDEASNGSGSKCAEPGPGARCRLLKSADGSAFLDGPARAAVRQPGRNSGQSQRGLLPTSSSQLLLSFVLWGPSRLLHADRIILGAAAKQARWGTDTSPCVPQYGNVDCLVLGTVFLGCLGPPEAYHSSGVLGPLTF